MNFETTWKPCVRSNVFPCLQRRFRGTLAFTAIMLILSYPGQKLSCLPAEFISETQPGCDSTACERLIQTHLSALKQD